MPRRKKNYGISEWPVAETDSYVEGAVQDREDVEYRDVDWDWTDAATKAQDNFTEHANRVVTDWVEQNPGKAEGLIASDDYESEDDIAWNTWAGMVGHGVGFWEHMDRADYDSLEAAIKGDKKLAQAHFRLDDELMDMAYTGVDKARGKNIGQEIGGWEADDHGIEAMSDAEAQRYDELTDDAAVDVEDGDYATAARVLQRAADIVTKHGETPTREQEAIKKLKELAPEPKKKARNPAPAPDTKKLKSKLLR